MRDNKAEVDPELKCPFCKGTDGYFYKVIESRHLYVNWDGTNNGGSEPEQIRGLIKRFCQTCDKDLTKKLVMLSDDYQH